MIEKVERKVRDAHAAQDVDAMTHHVLSGYGPEIYGFLVSTHGTYGDADEIFSSFSESLWRSLGAFDLRCSARTWAYRIARGASVDHFRAQSRRRESPASSPGKHAELAVRIRTATAEHLKTENKTALQSLRDELSESDRALLVLRVDRGLGWKELALVMAGGADGNEALDDTVLERESAKLRQRFQTVKRRLQELGRQRGLIGS